VFAVVLGLSIRPAADGLALLLERFQRSRNHRTAARTEILRRQTRRATVTTVDRLFLAAATRTAPAPTIGVRRLSPVFRSSGAGAISRAEERELPRKPRREEHFSVEQMLVIMATKGESPAAGRGSAVAERKQSQPSTYSLGAKHRSTHRFKWTTPRSRTS
jgi:hypothetical protein